MYVGTIKPSILNLKLFKKKSATQDTFLSFTPKRFIE